MGGFNNNKLGQKAAQLRCQICLRKREYPMIDKLIMAYIAVMLLFQIFFQISPMVTFLATTPLYSMQTYLGLLGGGLIVLDLFTTKRIWQGKFCILLYAILALAALASARMISYGMKENLFKLCWAGIQFVLVYSCAYRLDRDRLQKYMKCLYCVLLAIWLVACVISLYQYVNQIGYMYVVNPLAKDASANRQGFYDNRLFGIFYTLNHAAYISLFFFLLTVIFAHKEKRNYLKIWLIVVAIVLICHIILSGSRSATISLIVCVSVISWFATRNAIRVDSRIKSVACMAISLLVAVVCTFGYQGMKKGLSQVPYLMEAHIQANNESTKNESTKNELAAAENLNEGESILAREGLEEDASNGRLSIWSDYISLYNEIGLLGLSPGNYMPYVLENHQELYIVDYIKDNYPDKYESGIIYHVHSGYMMVYVSAGILGILSLAVFILLCLIRTIGIVQKNKNLSFLFIGSFALVVAGAISAALDEGLFFQNNPHTTMFWFALGILMSEQRAEANLLEKKRENDVKNRFFNHTVREA